MPGNSEEKDRGLTSGIAPADNGDPLVPAEGRFHYGCGILNSLTFETAIAVHSELGTGRPWQ